MFNLPQIFFDGIPINFVTEHKHLGLAFNNKGRWGKHIENIVTSASKIIGIMRKLKYSFSRQALNQIYMSYVLPILEYSSIVWDNCTVYEAEALDKIQNEAARIVTGLTRSVSLANLYSECGWIPLKTRRQEQKQTLIFKAVNGLTPNYISDLIPPLVRNTTNHSLRNNNDFVVPYARTEISRKSCIPSFLSLWNSLDSDIRSSNRTSHFKSNLKRLRPAITKVPSFYLTGDRYLSVLYARIRNKCSNLNNDLFNNHLSPRPLCNRCQETKDAEHFLFICPNFTEHRITMFLSTRSFHPLNANKLLYGDPNLTDDENARIFTAVQNYIKSSKRF